MNEIVLKVINKTDSNISGAAYITSKAQYVRIFGKLIKYKWYHKLIGLKPITYGHVKGVDTSAFSEGDVLYISPDKPGCFTTEKPR